MTAYTVTSKNAPVDLAQKIAEAHIQALKNLAQPKLQTDGQANRARHNGNRRKARLSG